MLSRPSARTATLLLLALGAGCAASVPRDAPSKLLAAGKARAEAKEWNRARRYFEAIRDRHPSAPEAEEATFLVAEMRRLQGQHQPAFEAYKNFVERYPNSRYSVAAAEAEYALGMHYLEGRTSGFLFFGPDRAQGVPILEHMQVNFRNHSLADDALVRVADFQLANGEPELAAESYRRLLAEYPRSEFRLGALRALAAALWRQSEGPAYDERLLLQALRAYRDYVDLAKQREGGGGPPNPRIAEAEHAIAAVRERLAEKQLLVARLYERRNRPESAALYYRYCLREYADTPPAARAAERLRRLEAKG